MRDLTGKRVLVTGAASGIGRAAALAFAREGAELMLVDIQAESLDAVKREVEALGARSVSYVVDVSEADSVRALAARVESGPGGVDVLVKVAGVVVAADIADTTLDDWRWITGINLMGAVHTIHFFLPGMLSRGEGHILNVASVGGLVSFAMIGAYCTTKFGLLGLSEALHQEVAASNVGVTAFCPGLTRTPIVGNATVRGYSHNSIQKVMRSRMSGPGVISPERTGELIVDAVRRNRALVVTTAPARLLVWLNRLFPSLVRFLLLKGRKLQVRLMS